MMTDANFIPAYRLAARADRRRRRVWTGGCLSYAGALTAAAVLAFLLFHQDIGALKAQSQAADAQIGQTRASTQRVSSRIGPTQSALQANQTVLSESDWSILLAVVAESLNDETFLSRVQLEPVVAKAAPAQAGPGAPPAMPARPPCLVKLSGYGRSQAAVAQFVASLEAVGLFESVKVIHTKRQDLLASEAIAFELYCQLTARREVTP